jgi:hypothetical protein
MTNYPAGTVGGRLFSVKGVAGGTAEGTTTPAQTFSVVAVTIQKALHSAVELLRLNSGTTETSLLAEVFSCIRNPARAGEPDVLVDASSEEPTIIRQIEVDATTASGYKVEPAGDRDAVFNEGEKVTFSLVAVPGSTSNVWAYLYANGDSTIKYFFTDGTNADTSSSVGDFAQVIVHRGGFGGKEMNLVLAAQTDRPASV